MSILFSLIGKSDPVSDDRDGPLLHILRHYRPDTVGLFLTPEIIEEEKRIQYLQKTFDFIEKEWNGYRPKVIYYPAPEGVDFYLNNNTIRKIIYDIFQDFVDKNDEGSDIFVNISSGLSHLATCLHLETRHPNFGNRVKGVQVIMGKTGKSYKLPAEERNDNIIYYLENDLDNIQGTNRCYEDKIILPTEEYDSLSAVNDSMALANLKNMISQQDNLKPYSGTNPYVFISYAHSDEVSVKRILKALKGQNILFWFDENMTTGDKWTEVIPLYMDHSHYILFFESENFNASINCSNEVKYALEKHKPIGIVTLEPNIPLLEDLEDFHAIKFKDYDLARLIDNLNRVPEINECKNTKS